MVKAVVGEETQLKLIEDRLSQSGLPVQYVFRISQLGLVVGKLSSPLDRGFVFDLVPTPPNDAGEPACSLLESVKDDKKKGTKSRSQATEVSSLFIDRDWVAEHARQVARMLVGGVRVVGIYIWVSSDAFKNSTIMLSQTIKGVAEATPLQETDREERLLIHICYSPMRWTCRNCTWTSNITSSSLRPCDFKMGRVLTSLQTFKCTYNFNLRLPICHESASNVQTLSDVLRQGISHHAKELKDAKAIIDGNLVVSDEPCKLDGVHEVELLLPFMKDSIAEECSRKDALGVLVLNGSVCSFAYLNSKEPISQAVSDIKMDIIMSLQSRLDIICDEAYGDVGPKDDASSEASDGISTDKPVSQLVLHFLRKECSLPFPRRVFVPWLGGTYICDYLQPSETLEVLKDHCVELMSMEGPTDASTILKPEIEAPSLVTKSFWDVAAPFYSASSSPLGRSGGDMEEGSRTETSNSDNVRIMGAVLCILLFMLLGFVIYALGGSG
ncbi:protein odr-4 homolog isoform X2 [Juglans microcarpa x Juglans regia]|uniref:protein odr-4 homolog isoform X2 n=1 Tax=Juglans microcarpa x Juglans regia TaxID=2249226 RepID=UPI001B7F4B63|nr:protein odr-4 homolog isoform X2 [Juglans microcarpa x Juglans regia]